MTSGLVFTACKPLRLSLSKKKKNLSKRAAIWLSRLVYILVFNREAICEGERERLEDWVYRLLAHGLVLKKKNV